MVLLPSTFNFASSSTLPPPGTHLLLTQTLTSSLDFALYHLVFSAIKEDVALSKLQGKSGKGKAKELIGAQGAGSGQEHERRVIIVDLEGKGRGWWESMGRKLGAPIPSTGSSAPTIITPQATQYPDTDVKSDQISESSKTNPLLFDPATDVPTLKPLYRSILSFLPTSVDSQSQSPTNPSISNSTETAQYGSRPNLIVLDGLSSLLWMGFTSVEVGRFLRALKGVLEQTNSILISTLHAPFLPASSNTSNHISTDSSNANYPSHHSSSRNLSETDPEKDLFLRIIRMGGGFWWRVEGLGSGRSGVVSGEISCHPLPPLPLSFSLPTQSSTSSYPSIPRCNPLQYRIEDGSSGGGSGSGGMVKVFAKGLGEGYV